METITGSVSRIIYRNDENGYTVLELLTSDGDMVCVGYFAGVVEGRYLKVNGSYTEHPSYGTQFKAESFELETPKSAEAIETYLGSGAIKGIGRALAARIVKRFGADSLRILEEEPERLAEVKGISIKKAREIAEQTAVEAEMRRAMMFLAEYGISMQLAIKIWKTYGDGLYGIIRENPYRLAEDVDGVGFLKADRIAAAVGVAPESSYRIRSGIVYALDCAAGDGSIYLPEDMLLSKAASLLELPQEMIENELSTLAIERKIVIRNGAVTKTQEDDPDDPEMWYADLTAGPRKLVYTARYYNLELHTARMLSDLAVPSGVTDEEAEKKLSLLEQSGKIRLAEEQRRAVLTAAKSGLLILTGGPGTGKTTTINEIIRYFVRDRRHVVLAAPTGRAAKRMTETTGYEASTIHRLLEVSASSDEDRQIVHFEKNASNPLEADIVIIDEMSMVDIALMHSLLLAVAVGTRLILVGDVDQLPSVGPGAVLRDIISADAFPCVRLNRIFRQAESSDIVVNAHRINRGEQITLDRNSRDFFFLKRDDPNHVISNIIELVRDKLPKYVNATPFDIQVLAPMRKGPLGVERLNLILQAYLNPQDPAKAEKQYGDRSFRVGDKVMQTRNNYQLMWEIRGRNGIAVETGTGIFNGDLGVIRGIDDMDHTLSIEFDDGKTVDYPFSELEDLELAYAVTIHKSQGSEYPAVILPLLSGPKMLMTRNLLYTAVTRARSCAVILGSEDTVRGMIGNESELLRYTSLDERIRELCGDDMSLNRP